jgi:CMP/dCMP kinase
MTAKQIAIDGPSGAGKSTAAKLVAQRLGYLYIDTGAMYRAVGLIAIRKKIDFADEQALTALTKRLDICLASGAGFNRVIVDGEDVSAAIRHPEVGNAASAISTLAGVRQMLVRKQQKMAAAQPVVMDGRDIGTVVLPHATCKIYLTAEPRIRAERRARELQEKGIAADVEQIAREMAERDLRDSSRANSPLRQAADAHLLDNSTLMIEQVVDIIIGIAEKS